MASQVEIANRALLKLGAEPIISLGDNNKAARTMALIWETVRKSELRKRLWGFSLERASLPALSDAPQWGFSRAFQLPSDYLRIVQVNDTFVSPSLVDYRDGDDSAYTIEQGRIFTDFGAPLKIRYVKDITDPGAFDPTFVDVMIAKLAYEGCEAITQSNTKKEECKADYKESVRMASLVGAVEKAPQGFPDDAWLLGRL